MKLGLNVMQPEGKLSPYFLQKLIRKHGTCKLLRSGREERHILLGSKNLRTKEAGKIQKYVKKIFW
jgi:hypothetical protein